MNPVFRGRLRAFCPHLFYYTRELWTSLCMKRDLYRVVVQLAITSPHHWFVCTVFFSSKSTYFLLIYSRISWITNVGKFSFSASLQISENQRVDPLGSWMDFVKRPVGNFPGKCRKRKRPLVNPVDWLAVFRTITFFIQFEAWQYYALLSSTSRAHPVLQVLLAHRDLLALRELKWPRKFFSRSSKRWLKVGQCSFFHPGYISASLRGYKVVVSENLQTKTRWPFAQFLCPPHFWCFVILPWWNSLNDLHCSDLDMFFCQRLQRGDQRHWTDKPAPASYRLLCSPWRGWPPTDE